jgi:hypothetical protein
MKNFTIKTFWPVVLGLFLLAALSGCAAALGVLSTLGSGVASGADYLSSDPVCKTVSYDYDRLKRALFVALCTMVIDVDEVSEIENGEKIHAKADDLKIVIELKKITHIMTRIEIKAGEGLVKRDSATASAIVQKTAEIAKTLVT